MRGDVAGRLRRRELRAIRAARHPVQLDGAVPGGIGESETE